MKVMTKCSRGAHDVRGGGKKMARNQILNSVLRWLVALYAQVFSKDLIPRALHNKDTKYHFFLVGKLIRSRETN
jgi:hypothetical protein